MTHYINIGQINIISTFESRLSKSYRIKSKLEKLGDSTFRNYKFGIWYGQNKAVATSEYKANHVTKNDLVRTHTIGLDLVIFAFRFEFDRGVLHIKE